MLPLIKPRTSGEKLLLPHEPELRGLRLNM